MVTELSSVAVFAQCPPSAGVKREALSHHILVRTSASSVKWQVEPRLRKPQLLHRRPPSVSPLITTDGDAAELSSPLPTFPDPPKGNLHLINSLFLFSYRSQQRQESSERDDFYANMGSAIRIIREETPFLFYKDLNYSIYRDDITFRDPRNTFVGIDKYKLIFWALRFHGQMFFKAIWVEVLRIWQPSNRVIVVRWTVRGIPRVPWEAQGLFEGTSEYKLDDNGRIYEHKVNNIAPSNPSYLKSPALLNLIPSAPHPTPTLTYFKRTALTSLMNVITVKSSTWERFYLALAATLDIHMSAQWMIWYLAS